MSTEQLAHIHRRVDLGASVIKVEGDVTREARLLLKKLKYVRVSDKRLSDGVLRTTFMHDDGTVLTRFYILRRHSVIVQLFTEAAGALFKIVLIALGLVLLHFVFGVLPWNPHAKFFDVYKF
jgi:hypothetical protein